jgi:serine/threonine-protein kinase
MQPDGTLSVKVLDFGIAKVKMDRANLTDSKSLTQTGSMLGSPLYMSPEQARGSKSIDHRADIWSLGVVLYQALTGRTPNQDIDALGELIIAICSEPATPVQQFAPWVSPEVAAIVHRSLCFDPAERFQSAGEMAEAIGRLLPEGLSLRSEQVVSVDPEERARVAPTLPLPRSNPPPPLLSTSGSRRITTGGGARMISRPAITDLELSSPPLDASLPEAGTPLGLANSPVAPAPPAKARLAPLFLWGAFVLVVGLGLHKLMKPGAPVPASPGSTAPPSLAPASAAPASAALPSATVSAALASSTASAAAPSQRVRTVTVTFTPGDAKVEVDGASAQAKGGAIEITGGLGSVHQVRITRGAAKVSTDVVITEAGAKPPRIELETGVLSARPRPPPSAPTSAPTSVFKDKFE